MVEVGEIINGKYRLIRLIGEGGMGYVFEARHEGLATNVALKFLHPEIAEQDILRQRFLQEARVSAAIKNPHIVKVLDVDQFSGGAFLVMELLAGEPLSYLLERTRRLPLVVALEHMFQTLDGVAAAHALGIVHRDLKPDNLFVVPETNGTQIKILDFGIAKLRQSSEYKMTLTRPGSIMGTPEYMAPEQAYSADLADSRSDVFSLGVILFEMLSGKRPVEGETPQIIAEQILTGKVLHLDTLCPALPPGLTNVVHTAMAADPDHRWKDAIALRDALLPFVPKSEPLHSPYGVSPGSANMPFSGLTKTPRLDGANVRVADSAPPTRIEVSGGSTEIGYSAAEGIRYATGNTPRPAHVARTPEKTAPPQPGVPAAMAAAASRTVSMPVANPVGAQRRPGSRRVSRLAIGAAAVCAALVGAAVGGQMYLNYIAEPLVEPPRPVRRTPVAAAPVLPPVALPQADTDEDDDFESAPRRTPMPAHARVETPTPVASPKFTGAPAISAAGSIAPAVPVPSFNPVVIPLPELPLPALPSNIPWPQGLPTALPGILGLPAAPAQ